MLTALVTGLVYGLSAGIAPGPMLALVIAQTLRHNAREGMRTAISPLLTDLPIILLAAFALRNVASSKITLGWIALSGAMFTLFLAWESFQAVTLPVNAQVVKPRSLLKGIITNLLNPHPYLFWFTIGVPVIIKSANESLAAAIAFLLTFYLMLIGSKMIIAALAGRSSKWLTGRRYQVAMRCSGVLLVLFSLLLFREAWQMLYSS
jgi:threonine/homoserine/homoserine lactone efflux protein